jgi:hypothetical protein
MVHQAEGREPNHLSYEDMSDMNLIGKTMREEVMVLEGVRAEREVGGRRLTCATMGHVYGTRRV